MSSIAVSRFARFFAHCRVEGHMNIRTLIVAVASFLGLSPGVGGRTDRIPQIHDSIGSASGATHRRFPRPGPANSFKGRSLSRVRPNRQGTLGFKECGAREDSSPCRRELGITIDVPPPVRNARGTHCDRSKISFRACGSGGNENLRDLDLILQSLKGR